MIPVFQPSYGEQEKEALAQTLESRWTGLGPRVAAFEEAFARSVGSKHAIALNSCTSALHLALHLVGVEPGGAVLCPSLTFVSSAHAITYCGATPIFMDTDPHSLCSLPLQAEEQLARKSYGNLQAIVSVLYAGQPCGIPSTTYPVVYDCAHAMGSTWPAAGKISCWSFHAVKNLSCGEGGMITLDDDQLAERARRLRWMGISTSTYDRNYERSGQISYKWNYSVDEIGWKYNMSDLQAALGLVQLSRLKEMQARRSCLMALYREALSPIPQVKVFSHVPGSSHHLMIIRCQERDHLHSYLRGEGISTGVHYRPIHTYKCYGFQPPLPTVEREWQSLLTLPLYPDLTDSQVEFICSRIQNFYRISDHYQPGT